MVEVAVVKTPEPDPKSGKPKPKSEVSFPYYDLNKSIQAARVIHEKAGGRCDRSQLASMLEYSSVKNGGFLSRISAGKMFGLLEEYGDSIVLSDRAKKIISPVGNSDADQAKADAFLNVELFRRVFEEFNGHTLPGEAGLKNLFENTYKIVPKQVASALRIMLDSADTAGYFRATGNRSKMVKPIISLEMSMEQRGDERQPDERHKNIGVGEVEHQQNAVKHKRHGGGGGGGDDGNIDPALIGLLRNLPSPGSKLGPKRRIALIEAFKSTINFIYPEEEELDE